MAAADQNDFQRGDDFISFGGASPPPTASGSGSTSKVQAEAGPSRLPLSSADQAILNTKNGHRQNGSASTPKNSAPASGKKAKKGKGKGKEKEKEPEAVAGKKRGRGPNDPVGPRNLKEERRAAERHAPWTDMVDWDSCHDPAEMLNAEIDAFYRYVSPTKSEYEVRLCMIELITRAVLRAWPDSEVTPFGSWQTQLYLPHGDIDLVVSTKRLTEANKARMLAELARAMREAHITDVVAIISKARVPIIKFITTEGKLNVDISLNQTNGITAGNIVNQYLDVLPGCRQLILVVKAFLSQRSMNEVYTGGLGSYAVICLVISFLQLHPKLRRGDIDPEENLGTLLVEFFELYGRNYSFDEVGISIRRGGSYFSKKSRGWYNGQRPFLLCIEDPQDRDNDISSGSYGIRQVKNTLAGAYEMLQARLFERAEQISGRKAGRYTGDWDPEEMSILTGVMGITKETQKHRREIQRLHEEGRLQRMLGIPPNTSPERYVQNYRPPAIIGTKRKAGALRLSGQDGVSVKSTKPDQEGKEPSRKKRKSDNGLAAVMMDDDIEEGEVGEDISGIFEDTDDEEEEDDEEEKDELEGEDDDDEEEEGEVSEEIRDDSGVIGIDSAAEDGEIVSILPQAFKGRDESVSHDSDDYEIQPPQPKAESEDAESRYDSVQKKGKPSSKKSRPSKKQRKAAMAAKARAKPDQDSDSSSGSSIIALSGPPSFENGKKGNNTPKPGSAGKSTAARSSGVGNKERRDFWSAKAGTRNEEEEGNDDKGDAFGDGSDFVRL